jgi:hypothetical protein
MTKTAEDLGEPFRIVRILGRTHYARGSLDDLTRQLRTLCGRFPVEEVLNPSEEPECSNCVRIAIRRKRRRLFGDDPLIGRA